MKKVQLFILAFAVVCGAAQYDVSMSETNNSNWGKTFLLKNDLCTLSIIPNVGGRIMSYCLGSHSFLRVVPDAPKGGLSSAGQFDGGGFMTWPAPQVIWNWPPPPYLAHGPYGVTVISNTADSVVISLASETEKFSDAAGLVFRKIYTFYKATSRVKVDVRLINKGSSSKTWSIREVAQVWATHTGKSDYSNFRAFFPKGTSTQDGSQGFWNTNGASQPDLSSMFRIDSSAGVVNFRYNNLDPKRSRIATHPTNQWLAYQDSLEGYTFVQQGEYQPSATYPEYNGAVIIMYLDTWLEMELCAPQKLISFNDSLQFVTNWYATKLAGPVRSVNKAGIVKNFLAVNTSSSALTGTYGVFYQGVVKIWFDGQSKAAKEIPVSPLTTWTLNDSVAIPNSSGAVSLLLYNSDGILIDTLDSKKFRTVGTIRPTSSPVSQRFTVKVLNSKLMLDFPEAGSANLRVTSLQGKTLINADFTRGNYEPVDLTRLSKGTYLVTLESGIRRYTSSFQIFSR